MTRLKARTMIHAHDERNPVAWLEPYLTSAEGQSGYARELAALGASATLHDALRTSGMTQKAVAEKLGKSKGFVSRALNGRGNLTVGTIAEILWACGQEWDALSARAFGVCARDDSGRDEARIDNAVVIDKPTLPASRQRRR